jgi:hypothetical protein
MAVNPAVTDHKRLVENMSEVLQIMNRIQGLPTDVVLLAPHRKFVRSSELVFRGKGLFGNKLVKAFLFNDLFLWTSDTWKYKGLFELAHVELKLNTDADPTFSFLASSPSDPKATRAEFVFALKDPAEKPIWSRDLSSCSAFAKQPRRVVHDRQKSAAM